MTTQLERRCEKVIIEYCKKNGIKLISKPCHIIPRAYVVGKYLNTVLFVVSPLVDQKISLLDDLNETSGKTREIRIFDKKLKVGDFCTIAYICQASRQENIAIQVVK